MITLSLVEKLHDAAYEGEVDQVEKILTKHPELVHGWRDPDGEDHYGCLTATAAMNPRIDKTKTLRLVLNLGGEPNGVEYVSQTTGLYWAIESINYKKLIDILLKYGADMNIGNIKTGDTPLHHIASHSPDWGVYNNPSQVADYLIKKGADVNAKNKQGITPLHLAALYQHAEVLKTLLVKGADPKLADNSGQTAFDYVCRSVKLEKQRPFKNGDNINSWCAKNNTQKSGYLKISELLTSHGDREARFCSFFFPASQVEDS